MAAALDFVRRLGHNASRLARRGVARVVLPRDRGVWVVVRLAPPIEEVRVPVLPFAREMPQSLLDVLQTLEVAAEDPQVDGVALRLHGAPRGFGKVLALRRAVERLRERGKPVVAWGERLDVQDLLIASAASRIWLPESGSVFLVGLRTESFFLRGTLDLLGVEPDVVRVGGYKTAAEMLLRERMSPEHREQVEDLLDDLYAELVDALARGRRLDPDRVRELIDQGPYPAAAAVEAGLVDGCLYPDELEDALASLSPPPPQEPSGEPGRVRLVDGAAYGLLRARDPGWRPLLGDLPRVAYVVANGVIHGGRGLRGVASESYRILLEKLRRDPGVRGVVLRISSPGGDSVASDLLWRSVCVTRRDKPVVVSMGDVAASGGYYVAAGADAVFAEAATVTGSIGVVGGKVHLEGLYERLGVSKDAVERGARAGLLSDTRPFTPDERAAVRGEMEAVYAGFVRRVAEGRGLSPEAVERLARGRIWSGVRARGHDLVDEVGGPLEALAEVRRRAGIAEDESMVLEVHPRRPRLAGLRALAGLWGEVRIG